MITKFDKYNESFNFNREFLKYLFNAAYNKALKHFLALHENIKEDHVLEFINHYITNNYGINFLYTVDMHRYVKYLLHKKFKNIKNETPKDI